MHFFEIAKLFERVFVPGNFLVFLLCLGVVLLPTRFRRGGVALVAAATLLLLALSVLPLNIWAMRPLEDRFARGPWPAQVDDILVLGGGEEQAITASRGIPTEIVDEGVLVAVAELMRRYPHAQVLFSGGGTDADVSESDVARGIFNQLGADQSRIRYEDRSRNTWENFLFSRRLAGPKPDQDWLLVTTALHMPRSMGIARKLSWRMAPWPTDYQTRGDGKDADDWNLSGHLSQFEGALHEWIGLVAYWWTGKTDALFPAP